MTIEIISIEIAVDLFQLLSVNRLAGTV